MVDTSALAAPRLDAAMARALELAHRGPEHGPNPRVGCVLLGSDGAVIGEGWHAGAGTPHAEVAALHDARRSGRDVRGGTAVVSLEPCNHTGRTGPCTEALLAAGVAHVVHAVDDPNPPAAGGAARLRAAGVTVVGGLRRAEGEELLEVWLHAVRSGRPWVTLKLATSLDGRVAAVDGTSRWITSQDARAHAHAHRAVVDAIAVGTGTALADDPALTVRPADGSAAAHQPLRVVVGHREVPEGARLRGAGGRYVHLRTHDVAEVVGDLAQRQVRHLLVEGGPTLAAAFLRAGVVDELHAYVAPVLLGAGPGAVADLGITTIGAASRWRTQRTERLGDDVLLVARPRSAADGARTAEPAGTPDPVAAPATVPTAEES